MASQRQNFYMRHGSHMTSHVVTYVATKGGKKPEMPVYMYVSACVFVYIRFNVSWYVHVHAYTIHRGSRWHWHEDRAYSQSWVCLIGHPKNVMGLNLNFLHSFSPLTWPWIEGNDREVAICSIVASSFCGGRWWKTVEGRIKIPIKRIYSNKILQKLWQVNRWVVKFIEIPHTFAKYKFTTSPLIFHLGWHPKKGPHRS